MQHVGALGFCLAIAALAVGMLTPRAHAYLDPGTGSMILQVLLGGVAGLALAGKLYWHKLRTLLGIGSKRDAAGADDGDGSGNEDAYRRK